MIDCESGQLFTEDQYIKAVLQTVRDKIYTAPGDRPLRPQYGSLSTVLGVEDDRLIPSIQAALEREPYVKSIHFLRLDDELRVNINGILDVVL